MSDPLQTTKKKGAKKPSSITPEYIEEQRKLRELKKEKKRQELIARGIDPDAKPVPENLRFIKRELLKIPYQKPTEKAFQISIMCYNLLAQALIRRKLFPTSGNALKWANRSQVLLSEFEHYNADIVCLQELDYIQYTSFWKKEFARLGYGSQYYRAGTKNHGVAVLYKLEKFEYQHCMFINYDKVETGDIRPTTVTQNVGMMVYLTFTDPVLKEHPGITRDGIIVGTTHLFWHPFGTFERTRQTYIVLQQMKEFTKNMNLLHGADKKFYRFFAGDFNSQPYDTPYLSMTAKPIKYTDRARNVIGRALLHKWTKKTATEDEDEEEEDEEEEDEEEEDNNPVPENFVFKPEALARIEKLEALHNQLDMRSISLYSVGYHLVHAANAGLDNDRNEPFFSNWAHAWRGLLDYIFVVTDWDGTKSYTHQVDTPRLVEQEQNIRLLSLLRLPEAEEMGPEPSGQPRAGQYPSDHLCLLATVELC